MKKILIVCTALLCLVMTGCENGTTSGVERLDIIGKWFVDGENDYWELDFIDSSNFILTTTYYGWTGTGTYTLADQEFEDGARENTSIRELGKASFELDYIFEEMNYHMSWTADYIINSNQRMLYFFNFTGQVPCPPSFRRR